MPSQIFCSDWLPKGESWGYLCLEIKWCSLHHIIYCKYILYWPSLVSGQYPHVLTDDWSVVCMLWYPTWQNPASMSVSDIILKQNLWYMLYKQPQITPDVRVCTYCLLRIILVTEVEFSVEVKNDDRSGINVLWVEVYKIPSLPYKPMYTDRWRLYCHPASHK